VHGAKGLEAPVVFLTDTCKTPDGRLDAKVQWSADGGAPALLWSPFADQRCQAFRDWAERERTERAREYRRLLYVAMTRAADRLYVTGFEDSTGRADGCWYDLVQPVVADLGRAVETADGETGWRYETKQEAAPGTRKADGPAPAAAAPPPWLHEPATLEPRPGNPLQPSRPTPEEPPAQGPFDGEDTARFQRGLLVHKLLETLPALPQARRADAARRWLAQPAHGLGADAQEAILGETLAVLDHPGCAELFAPEGLAEVALSGVVGGQVVSARLDRLAVTGGRVTVIDYKTNRPAPQDAENVPERYLRQMALYRALLARIYPEREIRCLLLWTDGPRVMALEDDILRAYAPPGTSPHGPA